MKRVVMSCLASFIVAVIAFWVLVTMLYSDSFTSLASVFTAIGIDPFSGSLVPLVVLGLASAVVFVNVLQVCLNRLWIPFFKAEMLVYFIALLAVLFLKSRGIQELNLYLGDVIQQVIEYPSSVLLNIALFVPLGGWLFTKVKSIPKAFAAALVFVLAVETIQYVFSLGIADVVDVLLNMLGFAIGYLISDLCAQEGLRLEPDDKAGWCHFRLRGRAGIDGARHAQRGVARRVVIPAIGLIVVLGVLGFFAFTWYDYHSYEPWEDQIVATEDTTLSTLPERTETVDAQEVLATLSTCSVDGVESADDWITAAGEDGLFEVKGIAQQYERWLDEDGAVQRGFVIAMGEECNGIEVAHAVPVVLAPDAVVELDGEEIDLSDESEEDLFEETFAVADIEADFTIQDGWLEAQRVTLTSADDFMEEDTDSIQYEAMVDFGNLTTDTKLASGAGSCWMDLQEGKTTTLSGYIDSFTEYEGQDNCFAFRVLDSIDGALVCHEIRVYYDESQSGIEDEEPVYREVAVTLEDGRIRLAG